MTHGSCVVVIEAAYDFDALAELDIFDWQDAKAKRKLERRQMKRSVARSIQGRSVDVKAFDWRSKR